MLSFALSVPFTEKGMVSPRPEGPSPSLKKEPIWVNLLRYCNLDCIVHNMENLKGKKDLFPWAWSTVLDKELVPFWQCPQDFIDLWTLSLTPWGRAAFRFCHLLENHSTSYIKPNAVNSGLRAQGATLTNELPSTLREELELDLACSGDTNHNITHGTWP